MFCDWIILNTVECLWLSEMFASDLFWCSFAAQKYQKIFYLFKVYFKMSSRAERDKKEVGIYHINESSKYYNFVRLYSEGEEIRAASKSNWMVEFFIHHRFKLIIWFSQPIQRRWLIWPLGVNRSTWNLDDSSYAIWFAIDAHWWPDASRGLHLNAEIPTENKFQIEFRAPESVAANVSINALIIHQARPSS